MNDKEQTYEECRIEYFRRQQAAHERELKRLQRQMPNSRAELMRQYAACVNECEIAQYYEDAVRMMEGRNGQAQSICD